MPDIINLKTRKRILYLGYWQTEEYFKHIRPLILKTFRFNPEKLSKLSTACYHKIQEECSVSVHIRRGDYLFENNKQRFYGICDLNYYKRAILLMQEKVHYSRFYVFSDDIEWAKENIQISNAVFIDWNVGKDAWQDMFLMSQCKHNIIANSTFSWWGAWLNTNPDKLVISPSHFMNTNKKSDIIPAGWLTI